MSAPFDFLYRQKRLPGQVFFNAAVHFHQPGNRCNTPF